MPILHIQLNATGKNVEGQLVQVPPSIVMQKQGPYVKVTIGLAQSMASQLLQKSQHVPSPVSGIALIDTGASTTCVDDSVAIQMQLPVVNVVNIASASHASTKQNVYPVQIEVVGLPISIETPNAIGAALSAQGLIALIGRDVLQHCTLFYNGITGSFTLSI